MSLGAEFGEKLTHLMTATAIYCTTATGVAPQLGVLGLVEALLGAAALGQYARQRLSERLNTVLRCCTDQIERSSDEWIDSEFRDDPNALARRDAAIAAIREVLPLIIPKAEEFVEARLDEARVASYYLDRAAKARPFDFADKQSNDTDDMARREITRRLFNSIVAKAYGVIMHQPEFAAKVIHHTLAELLQGQDALREGQDAIRGELVALPDAVAATLIPKLVAVLDAGKISEDLNLFHRLRGVPQFRYQDGETHALWEKLIRQHDLIPKIRRFAARGINDDRAVFEVSKNVGDYTDTANEYETSDLISEYLDSMVDNLMHKEDVKFMRADLIHMHNAKYANEEVPYCASEIGASHQRTMKAVICHTCPLLMTATPQSTRDAERLIQLLKDNYLNCDDETKAMIHFQSGRLTYIFCQLHPDDRKTAEYGIRCFYEAADLLRTSHEYHPVLAHVDFFLFSLWQVWGDERKATYHFQRARRVFALAPYRGICFIKDEALEKALHLKPRRISSR